MVDARGLGFRGLGFGVSPEMSFNFQIAGKRACH